MYLLAGNQQTYFHFDPVGVYAFALMMGSHEEERFHTSYKRWTALTWEDVAKLHLFKSPRLELFRDLKPFGEMGAVLDVNSMTNARKQILEFPGDVDVTVWTTIQRCGEMVVLSPLTLHGVEYVSYCALCASCVGRRASCVVRRALCIFC